MLSAYTVVQGCMWRGLMRDVSSRRCPPRGQLRREGVNSVFLFAILRAAITFAYMYVLRSRYRVALAS